MPDKKSSKKIQQSPGGDKSAPAMEHSTNSHHDATASGRLVPRSGNSGFPIADVAIYQSVSMKGFDDGVSESGGEELSAAVSLAQSQSLAHTAPAEGVILTHAQGWYQRGITLGPLIHSLSLAPGEVTQIAVVEREHTVRGISQDSFSERKSVSEKLDQRRAVSQITSSVANEMMFGHSSSRSESRQGEAGVGGLAGLFGGSASGGSNSSVATQVNVSSGSKQIAARAKSNIKQHTRQSVAQASARQSVAVEEVSELSAESFRTRVVANYNHMHALNMQYYEVVQVYDLKTKAIGAERCIFVPMDVIEFNDENIRLFARELENAARMAGLAVLSAHISRYDSSEDYNPELVRDAIQSSQLAFSREQEKTLAWIPLAERKKDKAAEEQRKGRLTPRQYKAAVDQQDSQIANLKSTIDEIEKKRKFLGVIYKKIGKMSEQSKIAVTFTPDESAFLKAIPTLTQGQVLDELNDRKLYFNQAIWMQMDAAEAASMVAGKTYRGEPIAPNFDPTPVAVTGNYVAYRWSFPDTAKGRVESKAFDEAYGVSDPSEAWEPEVAKAGHGEGDVDSTVAIPTGALFAESVLGESNAAEKLDLTRFWKWDENTIPIKPTKIDPLRSNPLNTQAPKPVEATAPTVSIQNSPAMPDMPNFASLIEAMKEETFRDMSGMETTGEMLVKSMELTGEGAKDASIRAQENFAAYMDFAEEALPVVAPLVMAAATGGTSAAAKGGKMAASELSPTMVGALRNALGSEASDLDPAELLAAASKAGFLM